MNLFVWHPNLEDPTSFYRAWGPLSLLRKVPGANINLMTSPNLNWTVSFEADIAFIGRPTLRDHLTYIHFLKEQAVPVWVDYDDDYVNPTDDNPRKGTVLEAMTKNNVIECVKAATVVTVTNEHLKSVYAEFTDPEKIFVIENALDDRLISLMPEKFEPKNVVFWRGNSTQQRDILHFTNQICEVYEDKKLWFWRFMGFDPPPITDRLKSIDETRFNYEPGLELFEYFRKLTSVQWGVVVKPLKDTKFARSRSNITWIEATLAGSACLAPNWESWADYSDKKGLVMYDDRTDFKKKLVNLLDNPKQLHGLVANSREYILENLLLSKINKKREHIIKILLGVEKNEQIKGPSFKRTKQPKFAATTQGEIRQ